jgi:hypothetical protein
VLRPDLPFLIAANQPFDLVNEGSIEKGREDAALHVPLASIAVPLASIAVPLASIAVPLASIAVPLASIAVPLASIAVPLASIAVPQRPVNIYLTLVVYSTSHKVYVILPAHHRHAFFLNTSTRHISTMPRSILAPISSNARPDLSFPMS